MHTIQYKSNSDIIQGTALNPITNAAETVLDFRIGNDSGSVKQVPMLQGNTQASFRFNYTHGSLTSASIIISFYDSIVATTPYQAVTLSPSGGVVTVAPQTYLLGTTDGRMSIDFQVPACDGIKIQVTSVGTTTSSTLTEPHLA